METQYLSFLLRIWLVKGDPPEFRFQLENTKSSQQTSFASLDALTDYLKQEMTTMTPARKVPWQPKNPQK